MDRDMRLDFRTGSVVRAAVRLTLATTALCSTIAPAAAQSAGGLEEVTVTARRFEESLQEAPVAVSAFGQEALEARSITNLEDIGRYVPNMQFFPNGIAGGSSGQPFIRGVGQFDFMITTDPGVAIYLDGVYLARSLGNLLDLVDVERIEVLRGPQGTLYGKNTIGGAINVVSRRPGNETELFGEVRVGDYDRIDARASVSLPVIEDRLAIRLAASTKNADGYGERLLTGEDMGDDDSTAFQAVVDWQPTDALDVTLAFDRTDVDQAFAVTHTEEINPAAPLQGLYNALVAPYDSRYITDDPYRSNATGLNSNEQDIWGASLTLSWQLGDLTLKSISGYRDQEQTFGTDPDGSPETIVDELDTTDQNQFSEELQLSGTSFGDRLRWVTGLYYFEEDADGLMDVTLLPGIFAAFEGLPGPFIPLAPGVTCPPPPDVPLPCAGGAGNPLNTIFDLTRIITLEQQTESFAAYAQASYQLTDPLSVTVGLRYTKEDKDFSTSLYLPTSQIFLIPPTDRSDSWSDVSPRLGVEYHASDDVLLYASAAKGFKSGGFNGRGSNANEVNAYEPEELWSYEVGIKSEWWERRVRLNAAAFFNDYEDLQFTTQTVAPDGTQVVLVGNAAKAEISGFEVELAAAPIDALNIGITVGYLDSKYTEIDDSVQTITLDSELIGAPEWTASASADFTVPLAEWAEIVLRSDYTYRSKTYFDAANTESVAQDGYGLWNAALTLQSPAQRWALTAGVLNVADEEYRVTGVGVLDSLGFASAIYGRPREWYVQASARF
jgi:iron complex outermembrane receptor protein